MNIRRTLALSSSLGLLLVIAGGCTSSPTPIFPDAGGGVDAAEPDAGPPEPLCDNLERDGDETGIDCGGACPGCPSGDPCAVAEDCESLVCTRSRCLVPTCMDGVQNGVETGTDCGGDCDLCGGGETCTSNEECLSGRCRGGVCADSSCDDGRMNAEETDIDCGGPLCPACAGDLACARDEDCVSLICSAGLCTTPSCNDAVQNQDETSVDCGGGVCPPCRDGLACILDGDCEGGRCFEGGCVSCSDGVRSAEETDVDCGGGLCSPCADGLICLSGSDCASTSCVAGICESCVDGVQNQDETDVDCGGALCAGCADGLMCTGNSDCALGTCEAGSCVSCLDRVQNQDETDADCGGSICPACGPGLLCGGPSDCLSAICDVTTGRCNAPGCGDGVLNGAETDLDCGGGACLGCADGLTCLVAGDCRSGVCTGGTCAVPTCSDGVFNGAETDVDCGGATTCARCITGRRCSATSDCATDTCMDGYCGGAAMCRTGPARVLAYGPGGTTGTAWFPSGTITTVATDAMWRSMTTADFGMYDVIYMAGGRCGGTTDSVHGTAEDTIAAWGPAIRGRVMITSDDADLHGGSQAMLFHQNLIDWLKVPGRNFDAGRTSLYISWGCTLTRATPGARGTPENFTSVLGMGITLDTANHCSSVTATTAAATHPAMTGIPPFWGCPFHGGFTTIPTGYTSLVVGTSTPTGSVLAVRDSPMPCIP